ncbi:glycoside hydrolase family 3 C-terminal domain-containing protein [Echinicola marina]|uniref:beta-glucosidase n=1 Tax=Echinicola marina TaxID=2859768 RepID=UPI001CF6D6D6|nr:glycoside hydrolase family 3 C-terminal domain-containing protein [Echinicola marina]UCS91662.1 glycoside hydrolase family 3 C-terminal domain-containing protein [Echinicola marina]
MWYLNINTEPKPLTIMISKFYKFFLCLSVLVLSIALPLLGQEDFPIYLDNTRSLEARVDHALSLMTLEEKVALTHAQSKFSVRGVPRLGVPELWMADGPHGIREELLWNAWQPAGWTNDSTTAFPALTALAATWNVDIAYLYGKSIGAEARYRKKDVLLGPGVNIYRSPLNGRNFEYMGEDPYLASQLVVPYIQGVQENGVAACIKHFALNNQETNRNHINVKVSERALHEIYLPAFKAAVIDGNVWSVMAGYNKYLGEWCAQNNILLNDILKDSWDFKGVVISDWDAVHNTLLAAKNGLDIEMGTNVPKGKSYQDFYFADPYLKVLKSGQASIDELDDKVRRILRLNFKTAMNSDRPWGSFATKEHAMTARKIAEEGIVLLKNKNQVLPIKSEVKSIAVIGENAVKKLTVGGGSSNLKVKTEISPLEGLQNKFGGNMKISFSAGYSSKKESAVLYDEAIENASKSDLVIFVGGLNKDKGQDSESRDRKEYGLPYDQDKLIVDLAKVNKNIVVILLSGNATAMPWASEVSTIVQAWYGGSEAGNALANILAGDINPSGKLPFTINHSLDDYSAHALGSFPGDSENVEYKEDIFVGYRWNDLKLMEPLFPFGHGLSYTSFSYGKARAVKRNIKSQENPIIKVPLKNIGKRSGAEVVQVYVHDVESSVKRPYKELKAFTKVFLEPGDEEIVVFELPREAFEFYSEKEKKWIYEPGLFKVLIGSSSQEIKQEVSLNLL